MAWTQDDGRISRELCSVTSAWDVISRDVREHFSSSQAASSWKPVGPPLMPAGFPRVVGW